MKVTPSVVIVQATDGQYIELPAGKVSPICKILYELYDVESSVVLQNAGHLRLGHFDALRLADLDATLGGDIHWRGGKAMRYLGQQLAV